jgi:hypothetical protein
VSLARALATLSDLVGTVLAGFPPRCRRCGERASEVEEQELIAAPPIFQVVYRCPRCGAAAGCRTLGLPDD